jgi:hypothetical protein
MVPWLQAYDQISAIESEHPRQHQTTPDVGYDSQDLWTNGTLTPRNVGPLRQPTAVVRYNSAIQKALKQAQSRKKAKHRTRDRVYIRWEIRDWRRWELGLEASKTARFDLSVTNLILYRTDTDHDRMNNGEPYRGNNTGLNAMLWGAQQGEGWGDARSVVTSNSAALSHM